jgi:cation/acetate symporter
MDVQTWTYILVFFTFSIYIGIAIWSRASTTKDFYVAGGGVPPLANGLATAADWMSAASFIGMAGIISFVGRDGAVYLMGWTGGYVLLALLLAPYLRKFGKYTVPDFVGDRYYSQGARLVAVLCAIFVSFTYVCGQMRGVGVVFSRFLEVDVTIGVCIGMAIVFFYAVLGGMKGITYTQVAQYCVLIFAFLVPAIFISIYMTGNPVPQLGFGGEVKEGGYLLDKLDALHRDLGFDPYTSGTKSRIDVFCITAALMVGTAGLPHVIIRFFTVPKVRDARLSAGYALFFIAILYTTAPAVAAFARTNLIQTVSNQPYKAETVEKSIPEWFTKWENTDLIAWVDKNDDGLIQYTKGAAFAGKPVFTGERCAQRQEYERVVRRPGHHGACQSGDRQSSALGHRSRCCRWSCRSPVDRGRTATGDFHVGLSRSAEEGGYARYHRQAGVDVRTYRRGRCRGDCRTVWDISAGLCRCRCGFRLRSCSIVFLPGDHPRYLLEAYE